MIRKHTTSRTIYCKIMNRIKVDTGDIFLIKQLNNGNRTYILTEHELKRLNLLDWIKVLKYLGGKEDGSKSKSI